MVGNDAVWRLPGRRDLGWRHFGAFEFGIYDRGEGEGFWRGSRHRLVVSLTPRPPILLQIGGGPVQDLPADTDPFGFYPAGTEVRTVGLDSRYAQICWDPAFCRSAMPGLPAPPEPGPGVGHDALIARLATTLAEEGTAGRLDRLLAESLVTSLVLRVAQRLSPCRALEEPPPDLARRRLRRVLDHIEAHLGEELALGDLAGIACLSPFHFSRSFKQAMGVGPRRYVMARRVERARLLLTRGELPIAAIAAALGFADQAHLTHAFRRETGTTPARWRAERHGAATASFSKRSASPCKRGGGAAA